METNLNKDNNQTPIEKVSFSIGAGLINRLGKELVGKAETAVSELIKNAYDADATLVELTFKNSGTPGGILTIDDNGSGMTREQLINGFMRIASTDKVENPISPIFKRSKAGKKGIGRFATQRLGEKLIIITQTKENEFAQKITINWSDYDMEDEDSSVKDKDLTKVEHIIESIPKIKEEGTNLIIEGLRESWTNAQVKRVYRYVSELLQPNYLTERAKVLVNRNQKENAFNVRFYYETENDIIPIVDEGSMIFDYAFAVFEGSVDSFGIGVCSIKSRFLRLEDENKKIAVNGESQNYKLLKNIKFKISYFIYNRPDYYENIPKIEINKILNLPDEYKGIRLYRNGFRVLPYGDIPSGDDWLGLDQRYSSEFRVQIPFANRNLFGFVEILDKNDAVFEETASREGLIENEGLLELKKFVKKALDICKRRVAESQALFEKKKKRDSKKLNPDDIKNKLKEKIELENKNNSGNDESNNDTSSSENKHEKDHLLQNALDIIDDQADEIKFLRVLATLGLTMGEYSHEIRQYTAWFRGNIHILEKMNLETKGKDAVKRLKDNLQGFETYSDYYGIIMSKNTDRKLTIIEIREVVKPFIKAINSDNQQIILENMFTGYDLYTCPMHPSEWGSILLNLYTNAKKAIVKSGINNGRILINCGKENNKIFVEFQDNGIGIADENKERIFNAFFTTSTPLSDNDSTKSDLLGSGLGLHIVKSIIESYNGEIFVSSPLEGYKTSIRIEIPSASDQQIEEYEQN